MTEILAPAGNRECALAAIDSGADAIYLGYSAFSARAGASNFDSAPLREIIGHAHLFGVRVYVAMNTLVKENELTGFAGALSDVIEAGADAVLLQDVFLGRVIHERFPDIPLHLSTQAGTNNVPGARLAREYGFSRVVLARETSLRDIREISAIIETEVFVQGALCTCFSGQCYLSSFIGGNSGNRGRCKQPCRKRYLYEGKDEKMNYALSLSDLSVGEKAADLIAAGARSLKIEGRMRRPEYVSAAVRYYRAVLEGEDTSGRLSDLMRTYNRGNYTQGLAFGQNRRFLSKNVQGHMGEKIATVRVIGGQYFAESRFRPKSGDGFKILRGGEEIGGAVFLRAVPDGFYIASRERLKNGDGVFITTDTALNERLLSDHRKVSLCIELSVSEGMPLRVWGGGTEAVSDFVAETARTSPLTQEEIIACFRRTDDYPFDVSFSAVRVEGQCFVPKGRLNAFRRDFFAAVYAYMSASRIGPHRKEEFRELFSKEDDRRRLGPSSDNHKTLAVMGERFDGIRAEIYILKPADYREVSENSFPVWVPKGSRYLYLPAFFSGEDLRLIEDKLNLFDGIYAEGYYGIVCARLWGKKLFAGTGFNLTNSIAVARAGADLYAVSKELDFSEQEALSGHKAFSLTAGGLKVMDILYCPFGKKCGTCDRKRRYILRDEDGRRFVLRRYVSLDGSCRFELYNCAHLVAPQNFAGWLVDACVLDSDTAAGVCADVSDKEKLKRLLPAATSGHSGMSMI